MLHRTLTVMSAVVGLSGCGGTRPRAQTTHASGPPVLKSAPDTVNPRPVVVGPVEKQTTQILTKSVARVLGFADVGDRTLSVYQDAYSALYAAIAKKNKAPEGAAPKAIAYYAPVFVADKPEWALRADGRYRIVVPNKFTPEVVRGRILSALSGTLEPMSIPRDRINMLPLQNVKGKVNAFGKAYDIEVSNDMTRVIVMIPRAVVPKQFTTANGGLVEDSAGFATMVKKFDSITFTYSYFVQKVNETACAFDLDEPYIDKMYIDSTCPKETTTVADAQLAEFEASNPNWRDLGTLVKRATMNITSCLSGKEEEKTLRRASISCTTALQASDGSRKTVSEALAGFATKTYEKVVDDAKLSENPSEWTVQAAAAAVAMFGSPQKFAQEITKFNNDILNQESIATDSTAWSQSSEFFTKLDQNKSYTMDANKKASSGGSSFLLISFGSKKKSSSENSSVRDIFSHAMKTTKNERAQLLRDIFKKEGLTHEVQEVGGSIKFYPRVTFSVKADKSKITQAAEELQTTELGDIVSENDGVTGDFVLRKEANLRGRLVCSGNSYAFTKSIQEVEWWNSNVFFADLSAAVKKGIPADGCLTAQVMLWFDAEVGSSFLPPSSQSLNISALSAKGVAGGSPNVILSFSKANTEASKATSDVLQFSGTVSTPITSLTFSNGG